MVRPEFSLAHLTVLGTTPTELIEIAACAGYDYASLRTTRHEEAMNYLQRVAERRESRTGRVSPRVFLNWQPAAKAILHYAQTHDADLIALTTRGRAGFSRLFGGSVVDQVVRGASVPVLVVRASGKEDDREPPNDVIARTDVVASDLVAGDKEDRQLAGTVLR